MASRFVRKGRTGSGAVAVQVVTKAHGEVIDIEHVGSAHTDAALALLLHTARELLHPGQGELDLGPVPEAPVSVADVADWTRAEETGLFPAQEPAGGPGRPAAVAAGGRVVGTASLLLWQVLEAAYARLGFDAVEDEAFKALVLGRVIEATSKADTLRVLADVGVPGPSLRTVFRSLVRCLERDYRGTLARACVAHSARTPAGKVSLILYDCTVRHEALVVRVEVRDHHRGPGRSRGHEAEAA